MAGAAVDIAAYDEPLRSITWLLLGIFVASLPWVVASAGTHLWRGPRADPSWSRGARQVAVLALVAGALARFAAPDRMVMHYMGYELLEQARQLGVTPKYGPSSFQWQHVVMQLGAGGHRAVIAGHRVLGCALPLLAAGWSLRLGATSRGIAWAAVVVALTPVLIHDATTESLLVESMTWALGSAWLLASALSGGAKGANFVLACAWALLAMLARPEMLATVPLLWLATVALLPRRALPSLALVGVALGAAVVIVFWRVEQLQAALVVEQAKGNTPRVFQDGRIAWAAQLVRDAWWDKNGVLWPDVFPIIGVVGGLFGGFVATGKQRVRIAGVAALAALWLGPTALDLPWVSVPRVQAPAMLLATVAAALGIGAVQDAVTRRWAKASGRIVAAGLACLWAVSALATVETLWWQGPAHVEERAMRDAASKLGPGPATVFARSHDDDPDERVHLAMPGWGFGAAHVVRPIAALTRFTAPPRQRGKVYAWLGTRCYMRPCSSAAQHPSCARLRARYKLRPVHEERLRIVDPEIPDTFGRQQTIHPGAVPDLDFPWCFSQLELTIGLYEVLQRKQAVAPPSG